MKGTTFAHATIMARINVYKELKGYSEAADRRGVEDYDLWFRFFEKGFKGYNLKEALYKVRDDEAAYKRRTFKNCFALLRAPYSCKYESKYRSLPGRGDHRRIHRCKTGAWLPDHIWKSDIPVSTHSDSFPKMLSSSLSNFL